MGAIIALLFLAIELVIIVAIIAGVWKTFVKAGKPGWAAMIPIYNIIVILQIAGKPLWWIILCLIPLVNIIIGILVSIAVAEKFGKGTGFGVGLALLGLSSIRSSDSATLNIRAISNNIHLHFQPPGASNARRFFHFELLARPTFSIIRA